MKWLNDISIRTQVIATAILFVLLCCACAFIGFWGQAQVRKETMRYNEFSQVAAKAYQIDRDVQEYKFRSDNFIHSGSQVHLDEANTLHEQLTDGIHALQGWADRGELPQILSSMQSHLETVSWQLNCAKQERSIRERIVNLDLPASERDISEAFIACRQSQSDSENKKLLADSQLAFETATRKTLTYFIRPDTGTSLAIGKTIREAISHLDQIANKGPELKRLKVKLEDHKRLCSRAVTATRSYLYYANVVLAGEVSEFLHYSARLKDFIQLEQTQTRKNLEEKVADSHAVSFGLAIAGIAAAMTLAALFCRQILAPISKLTATFHSLAAGNTDVEIPCLERKDEIGNMALAASVFNKKNTETRKLLARSQKLADELKVTNQELDNFAYVASHDLRSPLRGISNLAQWVQEDCTKVINEDSKKNLRLMEERVETMDKLLSDLLEYSRVGRVAPEVEQVDCQQLTEEIFRMVENEAHIELRVAKKLPCFMTVKTPLLQVFLNLVTNAIKYNDKDERGWVEIDYFENSDEFLFTVRDNGIGIQSKHFNRIFQMYQRVSTLNRQGSGMGLALVKKNVENYGGSITVHSEEGQGSTFTFTWPKEISSPELETETV